jgi:class 3 adenylate cyclase
MARTLKIMIVDDDPFTLSLLEQELEHLGYEMGSCSNGYEALEEIVSDASEYGFPGIVVTDIKMPLMDGLELMKRTLDLDQDLPIILITAHGDIPMAVQAMHDGAFDFIEKPIAPEKLIDAVNRAVEKRSIVLENRALRAKHAGVTRELSAILSADVEGYSRLMGLDEVMTVRTITVYREVLRALVHKQSGWVVDATGDNLLAQFKSALDAVQCAVNIQKAIKKRNTEFPEEKKMRFRIGMNIGDVIFNGERIYGDGVNIAARIESLAKGGGICISRNIYDHVKNKLALEFEYLGEHTLKNIAAPVEVYRVLI